MGAVVSGSGPGAREVGSLPGVGRTVDMARRLLAAGEWRPAEADADAAAAVRTRLTARLPIRAQTSTLATTDRDRRLQRVLRTTLHHLDAGALSPPTTALLAAVARAFRPWHAFPNPPRAAAAPRYPGGTSTPPTATGEALLGPLADLFGTLAAPLPPGTVPLTPRTQPWTVVHEGRFRHYGRPSPSVWTADTFVCPACGGRAGPWTVRCDWRAFTLGCGCGTVTREHGLAFSEVWLVLGEDRAGAD
ncbi:hypothetical protein ABZX40_31895 [Streptomyces sp. NPDC004610]|uniref:hypothetical protein n=1 Tax=unclassified Streptomyces TaxID=2593676 RepID=UPI00339EA418